MAIISSPVNRFNGSVSSPSDSKKSHLGLKLKVGSYFVTLLFGVGISNVTLANHPEWQPCCATATKAEIAKNLSDAAVATKLEGAAAAARLIELKTEAAKVNK